MGSASRTSGRSAADKVAVAGQQLAMRVNSAQAYHFRGNRGQAGRFLIVGLLLAGEATL